MQSPSSLIFLVLIGVWAAYFVQYWIRRRDHLATARSVEQFSAAMRVLERRAPIPRTDLSDPTPRSWAVHPARAVRPQVVVKRAVSADAGVMMASVPAPRAGRTSVPAVRIPAAAGGAHPSRRVRALTFLAVLVMTLVVTVLAVAGLFAGWAPLVALVAIASSFAWLRAGIRAEQAARAARRRRARAETLERTVAPAAPARPARQRRAPAHAPAVVASAGPADRAVSGSTEVDEASAPAAASVAPPASEAPVAPAAPEPVVEPAPALEPEPVMEIEYVHLVDEDDIPLTWDPVPVPRPTYTMKAKAERPQVAPAAVAPEASPVAAELRSHDGALDERRVAGA
ncbi:hypothetical protein [Nostocoides sp. Soil756]|uniref:hypothetical protein n=1 Tax=Nostocoides sp. Soil756 TaxID=1736399 RepID=UPI0006FB633A|nr:hypothetical protein [Tetrasphaera sp. Soil756]KRE61981.1 hypothetical protein ASG78_02550 [Tetrasphaera sp. Soil756]